MKYHKNSFYHLYNRGCNRSPIFFSDNNYLFLLRKIKKTRSSYGIRIIAYCLMPNHYHFLMQQLTDRPISDWIKTIFIGYVQAVNKEQKRKGTLFEGRVKHKLIDKEEYLLHIIRYIHSNPFRAGLVDKLSEWKYSNYAEWIGNRKGELFDKKFFNIYFTGHREYRDFVNTYLEDKLMTAKIEKYLFR